jgi:hypothetical protein
VSISSVAEDTALRLTPAATPAPSAVNLASTGQQTVVPPDAAVASPSPLAQLVKYVPTETITLYVATQAALGDLIAPTGRQISDANFTSRWIWMWIMFVITLVLTTALSYRSQKNANKAARFRMPYFDVSAAGASFLVWALSLPSTPLRDFSGYNYNAWDTVIILGGTVGIATVAYVLGKTVSWQKVVDS